MADTTRRLPVVETVSAAFSYAAGKTAVMIKLVWPWAPIAVAALILFVYALSAVGGLSSIGQNGPPSSSGIALAVTGGLAYALALCMAMASIAVEWHRVLLLGETVGWFHLKLRSRIFTYFGYLLAIMLVSLPPMGLLLFLAGSFVSSTAADETGVQLSLPLLAAISYCAILIMSRLFLVLPGAAVGDRRLSLMRSIALTKGNTLRIAGGFVILTALGFVLGLGVAVVDAVTVASPFIGLVTALLGFAANLFLTFVGLSYMSYCYWFFVPPPQHGDLA